MQQPNFNDVLFTANFLREKGFANTKVAIVLGTGLSKFADLLHASISVPYTQIPNFPPSTVEFHKGKLLLGKINGVKIIAMQGRFHYYEGYSMYQVTFPIRVFKELGITHLLLSNAAGGLNPAFKKGDLVLIEDHINLHPDNPLRGLSNPAFGNRFVDMSRPYDLEMCETLMLTAQQMQLNLQQGVYVSVMGPNLESRAEYRYLRNMGGDMVGMSTVPEVIVANQVGIKCAALSVITDECNPNHLKPVDIAEILAVAAAADEKLSLLFELFMQHFK